MFRESPSEGHIKKESDNLPEFLYRLTYDSGDLHYDDAGNLIPHLTGKHEDKRSLPMVHPDEWQIIARFFLYNKLMDPKKTFRILKIRVDKLPNLTKKQHKLLVQGEYHAHIPKEAIVDILEGEWVNDTSITDVTSKVINNEVGKTIVDSTRGLVPILRQKDK